MDAPYQARDDTAVMRAGSGGVSICGMMPRNVVEVKRRRDGLYRSPDAKKIATPACRSRRKITRLPAPARLWLGMNIMPSPSLQRTLRSAKASLSPHG